jgi:DNA-binding transcriptional ArsR family regulator
VASLPPRAVIGAEALAALAVPARLAILNHLLAAGPSTASECAPVVGETPSNCSWHLRALAKVGLVEPAPASDGRSRPWQAAAVGFELSDELGAAADVALTAFAGVDADHADAMYRRHLARRELLGEDWRRVSGANAYALRLTPDELEALGDRIDELVRPYVRTIREDVPEGSEVVQVTVRAFPNPDVG